MKQELENKPNSSYRSSFIELVIVIAMFAVISILLVRIFLGTDRLQKKAADTSHAIIQTQMVAEQIKNNASLGETAFAIGMISYDNTAMNYCIYYDKNWQQTKTPSANIVVVNGTIEKEAYGRMVSADITAYSCSEVKDITNAEVIITLTTKKWVSAR